MWRRQTLELIPEMGQDHTELLCQQTASLLYLFVFSILWFISYKHMLSCEPHTGQLWFISYKHMLAYKLTLVNSGL